MNTWNGIIGARCAPARLDYYCPSLPWAQWRPGFVALHNTAILSLKQRPDGFSKQHILDLEHSNSQEQV